ncbi:9452_t:CDS:2, partial [Diversispora eburnea]
ALSETCAQRGNPIIINDYFKKLQIIIQEYSLTADCIWNINETEFILFLKIQKVLSKKSIRMISGLLTGALADSVMGFTDSEYMKENLFQMYINYFINSISPPSEIPFVKLKKEYSKRCDELYSSRDELVTKCIFAKVLEKVFNITYTPMTIINTYKTTGI